MLKNLFRSLLLLLISAAVAPPANGQIAAWADKNLQVQNGLQLWLDASRVNESRSTAHLSALASGDVVSAWPDSTKGRNLEQANVKSQPTLVRVGESWVMRFDGDDDHFRLTNTGVQLNAASVFMVVAPHTNPGDYRGFFSTNAAAHRDYESGMTLDLGPGPTFKFDQLNVEGKGFGGAKNLLTNGHDFGTLHTIEAVIDPALKQVQLSLDGKPEGDRKFVPGAISFDEITIGARFLRNGNGAYEARGPFRGDIAELFVYDRVLTNDETKSIRAYLNKKYKKLTEQLPKELKLSNSGGLSLVKAENPAPIQMLQPGFAVSEIPIELTNVNNVRYRADGKLVTLGYNGDIHLLSDTDGDGIEDKAEVFWKNEGRLRGPIGMLLTPPRYAKGNGVFVPSKGKVSLIVDTNGDDKADKEIIVATGWKEIPQNVDAVGIAMDKAGNLYFGLGTVNYANAYLVNDQGVAEYDIASDRGTVQKVSADFSKRETVCTGIRFPIAFAFNQEGDLFCAEQEGATWLPNGNPLDELLHIRLDGIGPNGKPGTKRHYGFPPRHPQHNPDVIDEPSTFDYSPQHQSTGGMIFNEPVNGGPCFGPATWANDAIVCGESRGKLWSTKLIKTPAGYVAQSQLFACLQMLTVDACVAPDGDLVVACHSGPPDWGTGPAGIGKLFRIKMTEAQIARPVATWAEGPQEIRIAFDHPLDATHLRQLTDRIRIEYGEHVRAGDRFENLMPPYAAVKAQLMKPRFALAVTGTSVTSDLRTLIINTAPIRANLHYAVTVPSDAGGRGWTERSEGSPGVSGHRPPIPATPTPATPATELEMELDVDFALHGVEARWNPKPGNTTPAWSGWLPHPDLEVAKTLLAGSAGHNALWTVLEQPGVLTLKTKLNVHNILRPAIQPGAKIDYEWPAEEAIVTIQSNQEIIVQATRAGDSDQPATEISVVCDQHNIEQQQATFKTSADLTEPVEVVIELRTGDSPNPKLTMSVRTNEDSADRPLQLHRFVLPWVDVNATNDAATSTIPLKIAELDGGSWARGRKVFRSETAGCFKCHFVGGGGARIGPDLLNMIHRDYASLIRDISNPSFAINPDYIGHVIALTDGRVLTGVLQSDGVQLLLGDEKGVVTKLDKSNIETMAVSATSVMPTGIAQKLTADQMKDLLTYLMTSPPHMPLESPLTAPPLRTQAEVTAALAGSPEVVAETRPLNLVLVDGPKDHGPGEHDYPAWKSVWEELLSAADNVTVGTAHEFPSDKQLAAADVLLFFQKGSFEPDRPAKLDAFLARGGGAVYIHWAVNGNDAVQEFSKRIGYASRGGKISYRHGPLTLDIHNTDHPIVRNFDQLSLYDESYWKLTGQPQDVTLLATSTEDGMQTPQMWTTEKGKGRVFVSIPGHYSWTFDDPLFRILLLRGIAWTAHEPVDRFNELATPGSRMTK